MTDTDFAPYMEAVALGSLKVDLRAGTWFDFECRDGGGVLALIEVQRGLSRADAAAWMRQERLLDAAPPPRRPSDDWRRRRRCASIAR
jgi:hypothetical protein